MNNDWLEFKEDAYVEKRGKPRVLFTKKWVFRINTQALDLIGGPAAVRFLWDAGRQRIGIRAAEPEANYAFPVTRENRGYGRIIRGGMFCKRFGIQQPESTVEFESIRVDDEGTLILDLKSAKSMAR